MTRCRTRTTLIAATAATALLLTACGESNDDGRSGGIPGADEVATEPTEAEDGGADDPADDLEQRPQVNLGALQHIYADDFTGDAEVDAILRDSQGFQDAVAEAVVSFESDRPALHYYIAGDALSRTHTILDNVYETGFTSEGTVRHFDHTVTLTGEATATFSICRDFSEVRTTNWESGEIVEEADPDAAPTLYVGRLEKAGDVWQTVEYDTVQGAEECR
ncbi:hypothetical protein ACFC1B_07070 [Streptomyces xiamenensis]|uniref:hypothetical protein n=1 Tax=Streptomyces xiamenensis TaxID=408015 RepID=UPI0035DC7233